MGGGDQGRKFYEEDVDDFLEWAQREFRDSRRLSDGTTAADHNESAARQWAKLGKKPKEEPLRPACPWQFRHIWNWLWDIIGGCPPNGMGPVTIGWRDVQAWCELTGERPDHGEVRLLFRLSILRATIEGEKKPDAPPKPQKGKR